MHYIVRVEVFTIYLLLRGKGIKIIIKTLPITGTMYQ